MVSDDKVVAVLVVALLVLALCGISVGYYTHAVTPLRMAEKGLCWDAGTRSYQLCREAK